MTGEVQGKIQKFLFHLSNENWAGADREVQSLIKTKVKTIFDEEYEKLKKSSKTNK